VETSVVELESVLRSREGGSESRSPRMAWAENETGDVASVEEGAGDAVDEENTVLYLSTMALEISMPRACVMKG